MWRKISKIVMVALLTVMIGSNTAFTNVSASDSDLMIGAWLGVQANSSEINTFQTLQGRNLDTIMVYAAWNTTFGEIRSSILDPIYNNGSIAIITWEQWGLSNTDITNGVKDSYIKQMANDMKSYGKEIWISLMHEANGNWYDWAIGDSKVNTNETYIAAYRHVVSLFRQQGATNVKWIWNINAGNCGTGTSFVGHYPGDDYVDYIAIDGYNWGTTQSWGSTWQTFDEIFAAPYEALCTIDKPILITEVSCAEIGGNKAEWITDAYAKVRSKYPRVKLVSWFGENKETDWRINSSDSALAAYRAAVNGQVSVSPSPSVTASPSVSPSPSVTASPSVSPSPSTASSQEPVQNKVSVDVTTSTSGAINQTYKIMADGSESIDLSKLTIRYTFTKDDTKNMTFYCDNAAAQLNTAPWYVSMNTQVKGSVEQKNNTCVLEITFTDSFVLESGYVQLQTRLANEDWSSITGIDGGTVEVIYNGIVIK